MKGARAALECCVLEFFKTKFETGEVCLPTATGARGGVTVELLSTPEKRPGRFRKLHLGGPPLTWPLPDALPGLPSSPSGSSAAVLLDESMGPHDPM